MNKILITGSHGVGKTTLFYHLASLIKNAFPDKSISLIQESVREISGKLGEINTPTFYIASILESLLSELQHMRFNDYLICDRTSFDFVVYSQVFNIDLPAEYKNLAIEHIKTFNQIYFIRPDNYKDPITDDNFRLTDIKVRKEVDLEFERMLSLSGCNFNEIKTSNLLTFDYLGSL